MRAFKPLISLLAVATLTACDSDISTPSSAFTHPIDFAYACEGDGKTVPPTNDESAATLNETRMCPDLAENGQTTQGDLFGVVLDRQPPSLMVLQLNPAAGTRTFIDADFFVPGVTGIPVGKAPVRVFTPADHSAFYVVSAGDQRVDRVVLERHVGGVLTWSKTSFPLPATPIEGAMVQSSSTLVVVPQTRAELWLYDLSADAEAPPLTTMPMPAIPLRVEVAGSDLLVTFRDRPTVAVYSTAGALLAEGGLVPACRNGLDDDEDGLADQLDPDCHDRDDDDESAATGAERVDKPAALASFDGAAPCDDGVDNDGDGATDFPFDLACASADDDGELRPQCDDGLDNDGDGRTDLDDESCYSRSQLRELQNPADGPFHPVFIDGGDFGRFVYVADERTGEIAVFDWDGSTLTRVDVNASDVTAPDLESVPFTNLTAEPTLTKSVPATRSPALSRQGIKNILITETNVAGLTAGRLRGELWDRILEASGEDAPSVSLSPNSAEWKPARCAPDRTDRCAQPALDDATWFAFGPNLEGRIQLIEAIRRGTPVHRLAQRVTDLSQRNHDLSAPRLTLRGRLINARGEPQVGFPFIGPALEEELAARVASETPARFRRFGVWPPDDFEATLNETWNVSYEGIVQNTSGRLGVFAANDRFVDPNARFCELGAAPGDWLQLVVPVSAVDPRLVHTVPVTLDDGRVCPVRPETTATLEVPITAVGQAELVIDPATARLRPNKPVLDEDAISEAGLSRRLCQEALATLDDALGRPENLATATDLTPAMLPPALSYNVRAAGWIAVGTRSGFLHRQKWDREKALCVEDTTLDTRLVGRLAEIADATSKYQTCPPSVDALRHTEMDGFVDPDDRFYNPSFGLDIFPACELTEQNGQNQIVSAPSQQDTMFTFTVTGPQQGSALSVSDALLLMRVPLLDFRRQQVQLDAAARKASILQLRLGDPRVIITFE